MKPIAITLGDPAGVGAEVVFKALAELSPKPPVLIIGDRGYASQAPHFDAEFARARFVDVGISRGEPVKFGVVDAQYGRVSLASLEAAVDRIDRGECSALVTAPIHKEAIAAAGSRWIGHTEFLAERAGLRRYGHDYAMYFDSPELKVVLLSVHIPLGQVVDRLDYATIEALAALTRREFHRIYGSDPRIAVAGVNPHAGEGGILGDEEREVSKAIERARAAGVNISGPYSPDTVFMLARRGRFDVVMAMYHDQGLIPIKTLDFERAVNITLGLPYLRCSVDHGTAFDIAGKGVADHLAMKHAIEWASKHAERFAR